MTMSRRFVLVKRPSGAVVRDDFRLEHVAIGRVADGGIELQTLFISIDPAIRGWLDDRPSYLPPVELGAPVRSLGLARVTKSRNALFGVGEIVRGFVGWQERLIVNSPGDQWQKVDAGNGVPLELHLGVLGMTGLTAWAGVDDILKPSAADTVLVTAAAGAVGSVAVQLAKATGARVIGVVGGERKCELVTSTLGADAAVDRRAPDWEQQLVSLTPNGIDCVFENVGGPLLEMAISRLNNRGRIALCGLIAGYNLAERPGGPMNFGMLLTKRILTQGFNALDYTHRAARIEDDLHDRITRGALTPVQTVTAGFAELPSVFASSFAGDHVGKLLVAV
jgi:hypothetical protein